MIIAAFLELQPYVAWIKALHVISVIAWMAGQLYLPRLFVYHCQVEADSIESDRFKMMEWKLHYMIISPAVLLSFITGAVLALIPGVVNWYSGWWFVKVVALIAMLGFYSMCSYWRRNFYYNHNRHSEKFYRIINEIPTILMCIIVIMVTVKPF